MPNCSKCKKPTNGHTHQWGQQCTMLSIDTVKSDDGTPFAEEIRATVGPETGPKTKTFNTTVIHWPLVNMVGRSTSLMQPTLGARNSVDTVPTDTSITLKHVHTSLLILMKIMQTQN